ncbi:hypothetical protein ASE63_05725 [Bosea sp. Root381]|uniref:MlaD family protein n=1 Tax=Bosea sp. Root381 TaxID=1736524 RepID=UPI0006FCBB68|nr:MlaD family protein [Bosea sp. Root381]KRE05820.1 hypothetical protein ASE63_05725 [Bosea sp. Root381]
MESRAKHALIGLFTLAALAALLGFAYWFSSGGSSTVNVRLIFNDKVSGLGRGASVLFNGLRVGEVTQIEMNPANPRQILAVIKVDRSTPLRTDTTARLEGQGLAGVVVVQLRGGDNQAAALTPQAGSSLPTIIAEASQDIFETVRTFTKNADDALGGIETALKQNAGSIDETVKNLERFSGSLSDYSSSVDKLMQSIGTGAEFIAPLTAKLGVFSQQLTETIRSVDEQYVIGIVDSTEKFTATLGAKSGDVRNAVKDVASMSEKLNRAAEQVEDVLKGAQAFLNTAAGQDGRSAFDDVADVAKSIRVLADNLDKSTQGITAEISRFTRNGLRSIQTFTTDGQRILNGVGRSLRQVERNPQGLIFGTKPALPQSDVPR